jgi:hypothetical protein
MKTPALVAFVLGSLLPQIPALPQLLDPSRQPSRLLPYTRCELSGGLAPTIVERAASLPMARPVETSRGQKRVSVADGYRMILAYPNTDPFVNLKIELSVDGQYAADKQTVLEQMQNMSATSRGVAVNLERSVAGGVDIAALNNPGLEGAALSFYTFFDDAKEVIVTAYVLNQLPARRAFQTVAEYQRLRDKFVSEFAACLREDN